MKQYFIIENEEKQISEHEIMDALVSGGYISKPEDVKIAELKIQTQSISNLNDLKESGKFYRRETEGKPL